MIEAIKAIILGIVQGVTEFLPISSSGHLVLLKNIFGIENSGMFFETMLHAGTLIAVIIYFWKDIVAIIRKPFCKMTLMLVFATIPAVVFSVLLEDFIESAFGGQTLGIEFIITGIIIFVADRLSSGRKQLDEMRWYDALIIGVGQAVAIMPAISRSGTTIATGLIRGYDRNFVARFSMLMSIPAILGSLVFEGKDLIETGVGNIPVLPIILGTIAAAIAGYFAIKVLMKVLSKGKLKWMGVYVLALGTLVIIDQYWLHIFF